MISKLKFWFFKWGLMGYPMSMLTPNWYKNLSVYWSPQEQRTQEALATMHACIGDQLIKITDDDVDWGEEVEYLNEKPLIRSWQQKLYDEEGIIL